MWGEGVIYGDRHLKAVVGLTLMIPNSDHPGLASCHGLYVVEEIVPYLAGMIREEENEREDHHVR